MNTRTSALQKFFVVGGALRQDAPSYIVRPADQELLEATIAGEFCNVLTARQMGKSSLMVRTTRFLNEKGIRTSIIDLTTIGVTEITHQQWYLGLMIRLSDQLKLSTDVRQWQLEHSDLNPVQQFGDFLHKVVLAEIAEPVVIFIDEIDSTLSLPFTDDFFATIRATYNSRADNPEYRRLTFALLGVARPAELIKDTRRTPYNIGKDIDLTDFTLEEVTNVFFDVLEALYPGQGRDVIQWVLNWTGGQPYLTQKLFATIGERNISTVSEKLVEEFVNELFFRDVRTPESNLRNIRERIRNTNTRDLRRMLSIYDRLLKGETIPVVELSVEQNLLKLTGLVRRDAKGVLQVRNKIYQYVFNSGWVKENMPANPARPWIAVSFILVVLIGAITGYSWMRNANQTAEARAEVYRDQIKSSSAEVRLTGIAGLFTLEGSFAEEARKFFFSLSPEEQLALFTDINVTNVQDEVLVVAQNVYQRIPNTAEGNDLLRAIAVALSYTNVGGASGLETEITYWLDGRDAAADGNEELAKSMYEKALKRSQDRGAKNGRILFDLAVYNSQTKDYDLALTGLDEAYQNNEWIRTDIDDYIRNTPPLRTLLEKNRDHFVALWQALGLPTSTLTVTSIPPTLTPIPPPATRTTTPTLPSTETPTEVPIILNSPDTSGCMGISTVTTKVPSKMLRLTIINNSGYDVIMKLTGCSSAGFYYYLLIPAGNSVFSEPTIRVFSVGAEVYSREALICNNHKSKGMLIMSSNTRLTFSPCSDLTPTKTPIVEPGFGTISGSYGEGSKETYTFTVSNPTNFDAFIKLEALSSKATFYYLTIPKASAGEPTTKVFKVIRDSYHRTSWICNSLESSGNLAINGDTSINIESCQSFGNGTPGTITPTITSTPTPLIFASNAG